MTTLSDLEKRLARAALGLPNAANRSYRKHYRAGKTGEYAAAWAAMTARGLARCVPIPTDAALGPMYYLTRAGAEAALEAGETLCPEDFPAVEVAA